MIDKLKPMVAVLVCLTIVIELASLMFIGNFRYDVNTDAPAGDLPIENFHDTDLFVNGSFVPVKDCGRYKAFSSEQELEEYANEQAGQDQPLAETGGIGWFSGPTLGAGGTAGGGSSRDYSQTNIQVAGVDEQDIVKTDGEYIYTISGNDVVIVQAYPTEQAGIASRLELDMAPAGLFIDGDRLTVISGHSSSYYYRYDYYGYQGMLDTRVWLYDISDRSNPTMIKDYSVTGSFISARMVGGYAYVLTSSYVYTYGKGVTLPEITSGSMTEKLTPSRIGGFGSETRGSAVTTILAIDASGDGSFSAAGYMTGGLGVLYVSHESMYLATSFYHSIFHGDFSGNYEQTSIHKIGFDKLETEYICTGEVPGRLLNQFSMDEFEGNLRAATTVGHVMKGGMNSGNNVYVLDAQMALLGSLENLAPGEQIHSARFLGERAYLVTFKKIDPFFVIDLSDPCSPKVLGYLKIPGFSDYLHPYGENYVIGIGKDTVEAQGGDFAWFQGLKLSLFDVTDVENPKEVAKEVIGDRGTDSEVLRDHKAFMFDEERGILAFPVDLYEVKESPDPSRPDWTYGQYVWQGAYVYQVSLDGWFKYIGRVTHKPSDQSYYYHTETDVKRSLYIENVLYTISEAMIKMNGLDDLAYIGRIAI